MSRQQAAAIWSIDVSVTGSATPPSAQRLSASAYGRNASMQDRSSPTSLAAQSAAVASRLGSVARRHSDARAACRVPPLYHGADAGCFAIAGSRGVPHPHAAAGVVPARRCSVASWTDDDGDEAVLEFTIYVVRVDFGERRA